MKTKQKSKKELIKEADKQIKLNEKKNEKREKQNCSQLCSGILISFDCFNLFACSALFLTFFRFFEIFCFKQIQFCIIQMCFFFCVSRFFAHFISRTSLAG